MGVEELELLRAAASTGGIQLASLSWIVASLAKHGFLEISPSSGRRLRAVATHAGHLVLVMRPDIADDSGTSIRPEVSRASFGSLHSTRHEGTQRKRMAGTVADVAVRFGWLARDGRVT